MKPLLHCSFKITYSRDGIEFALYLPLEMNWPEYLDIDTMMMNMWYKALNEACDKIAECGGSILKIKLE